MSQEQCVQEHALIYPAMYPRNSDRAGIHSLSTFQLQIDTRQSILYQSGYTESMPPLCNFSHILLIPIYLYITKEMTMMVVLAAAPVHLMSLTNNTPLFSHRWKRTKVIVRWWGWWILSLSLSLPKPSPQEPAHSLGWLLLGSRRWSIWWRSVVTYSTVRYE